MKYVYDYSIVSVNGSDVEEVFLLNNKIIASRILYHGNDFEDANAHLIDFWHPPVQHTIPCTIGMI